MKITHKFCYRFDLNYNFNEQQKIFNTKSLICSTFDHATGDNPFELWKLPGFILNHDWYQNIKSINKKLEDIKSGTKNHKDGYILHDDLSSGLLIQGDKTKILDMFHTEDGIIDEMQGPINYNITTPEEYHYLPTDLIIKMLEEWLSFITEQEKMCFVLKEWIRDEFKNEIKY